MQRVTLRRALVAAIAGMQLLGVPAPAVAAPQAAAPPAADPAPASAPVPAGAPAGLSMPSMRLALGRRHSCMLTAEGLARCWGSGSSGEAGLNGLQSPRGAVSVADLVDAISIDTGDSHTCAVVADGSVKCWGGDGEGQLGNGGGGSDWIPREPIGLSLPARMVATGAGHTCALLADATVWWWGRFNTYGSSGSSVHVPLLVPGVFGATTIGTGDQHTCAVLADTTIRCWGYNMTGQLGNGSTSTTYAPVAVNGLTGATAVAAGWGHTCALLAGGTVSCWGENDHGELGRGFTSPVEYQPAVVPGLSGVVRLAAGGFHTCALLADGKVRCWGLGDSGELGQGSSSTSAVPAPSVVGVSGAVAIATGWQHSCALLAAGAVRCWGLNENGQLGDGTVANKPLSVPVSGNLWSGSISAGAFHSCAIRADTTVACWGDNTFGQLGDGTTTRRRVPTTVPGLRGAIAVSAGSYHTCALLRDATLRCWGDNSSGQLGIGTSGPGVMSKVPVAVGIVSVVAVSAGGNHTCVIRRNSRASCWGANGDGQLGDGTVDPWTTPHIVPNFADVVAISAGSLHTCAIISAGTAWCWGLNAYGQLGDSGDIEYSPQSVEDVDSAVGFGASAAHGTHHCVVLGDASLRCWGADADGQLGRGSVDATGRQNAGSPLGVTGAVSVSAGFAHTCVLLAGGSARCWGRGSSGQLGNDSLATPITTPVAVAGFSVGARAIGVDGGGSHSCAVLANATARCWGSNGSGRLGDGTTTRRTAPVAVSPLSAAVAVSAGGAHSCAVRADGTARCWGANGSGQLGDGTRTTRKRPVTVSGLTGVKAIAAGGSHSCALKANGTVRCWGANGAGQLGIGSTTRKLKSAAVSGLSNVVAITAGTSHTCALRADGKAFCWGANGSGQVGDGTLKRRLKPVAVKSPGGTIVAISAGGSHTCAVLLTGGVRCWGANGEGQLGNGTRTSARLPVTAGPLAGARSVAAGGSHTCATLATGTTWCWGANASGQLGQGTTTRSKRPKQVAGLAGAVQMAAGGAHSLVLMGDGSVRAWGANGSGQVGDGTTTTRKVPRLVVRI